MTKTEKLNEFIKEAFNYVYDDVEGGNMYAIEALVIAKQFEVIAKKIKEAFTEQALSEVSTWNDTNILGYKATQKNGSTRYKFDHIEVYANKKAELKQLEADLKAAYLQAQRGNMLVDDNGEVLPTAEPVHGKEQVVLTLIK